MVTFIRHFLLHLWWLHQSNHKTPNIKPPACLINRKLSITITIIWGLYLRRFFNAGLGIIILSYLALAGFTDINTMNGIKLLVSSVVSIIATTLFIYSAAIAWYEGIIVLIGALFSGFVAAHASRRISQHYVRIFVILASIAITIYFFIDTYAS